MTRDKKNPSQKKFEFYVANFLRIVLKGLNEHVDQLNPAADELTFWVHAKETANNNPKFCQMCEKWSLVDTPLEEIKQDIRSALSHHFRCDDSPEILQEVIHREWREKRLDQDLVPHAHLAVVDRATIEARYDWPVSKDWSEKRITVLCSAMFWASVPE